MIVTGLRPDLQDRIAGRRCTALVLLHAALLSGCASDGATRAVPLFEGLGSYRWEVSTVSTEAQRYFDQGWVLYQAFNHVEARRSFRRAAELDPGCAMAHWGVALSYGPHINNMAMDEDACRGAHEALALAQAADGGASPVETALIGALAKRYRWPTPADRRSLDEAYTAAMRGVHADFPDHPDVAALYAEALMDLRPWDLWSAQGEPRPETPEVLQVLEGILARHAGHPLANHAYVHAIEASPHPEKGLAAADRLRALIPGAAHLVHMPSHIDIRLGRYAEAIEANERAVAADRAYLKVSPQGGFYSMYRAHNYHFLVYAAMFRGQSRLALDRARELLRVLPQEDVRAIPDVLEAFLATPYHVLVRFGRWEEILAEPAPPPEHAVTVASWRYARGMALGALGRVEEATGEQEAFERACVSVPESRFAGNNPAKTVLEIGRALLAGEIEYRRGRHDRAFEHLREAVRRDTALQYDEPWGWPQPAAHSLGALLLEQGRIDEAEAVYRADLKRHPGNGWSLHGLAECLRKRGAAAEALTSEEQFRAAWAAADVAIHASCFCRTGGAAAGR